MYVAICSNFRDITIFFTQLKLSNIKGLRLSVRKNYQKLKRLES